MSIRLYDVMELYDASSVRVLTDNDSLNNEIRAIGLLDYEPAERIYDQIFENDMVLSSLLFAKDNLTVLKNTIFDLVEKKVSVLGIKEIYYSTLPDELIRYANKNSLGIFVYDRAIFTESILYTVSSLIRQSERNQQKFILTDKLINEKNPLECTKIALQINPNFPPNVLAIYIGLPNFGGKLFQFVTKLKSNPLIEDTSSIYNYKDGILAIIDFARLEIGPKAIAEHLRSQGEPWLSGCPIGIGSQTDSIQNLNKSIQESIYATISLGNLAGTRHYKDLGIDRIIFPYLNDQWFIDYSQNILSKLEMEDKKTGGNLVDTAFCFFNNQRDIKKTAIKMYQHENTIRYRIQKMKELVNDQNLVQLHLAVRFSELSSENS